MSQSEVLASMPEIAHPADSSEWIDLDDGRYWLYAAVDPQTNKIFRSRLLPTHTVQTTRDFLRN